MMTMPAPNGGIVVHKSKRSWDVLDHSCTLPSVLATPKVYYQFSDE